MFAFLLQMAVLDTKGQLKLLSGIVVGLISLILGIIGFVVWKNLVTDFSGIVDNWRIDPVYVVGRPRCASLAVSFTCSCGR